MVKRIYVPYQIMHSALLFCNTQTFSVYIMYIVVPSIQSYKVSLQWFVCTLSLNCALIEAHAVITCVSKLHNHKY